VEICSNAEIRSNEVTHGCIGAYLIGPIGQGYPMTAPEENAIAGIGVSHAACGKGFESMR
jgi:hypothetical protein